MIRVGVVGFGLSGRIFHAAVVAAVPGLELAAIVERHGEAAAKAYPGVTIARSVNELLGDPSIRLIAITTPNETHFPIARQCLLADRDVVLEKPMTLTSEEAAELIRLARARKRTLTVYQNRRFDGDFRTVRQILCEGKLGSLTQFQSRFDRFRPQVNLGAWRESGAPGGGIFVDLAAHLIDQAFVLFGLPHSLWADIRMEREGGRTDDAFDLCLFYPPANPSDSTAPDAPGSAPPRRAGLTAWLHGTRVALDPGPRFLLHGTRGSFCKFGLDPQEDAMRSGDLFQTSPWGVDNEELWGVLTLAEDGRAVSQRLPTLPGDYRDFYANLRDALLQKAPAAVAPVESWRVLRAFEMARASSRNQEVVACDWSAEP